MVWGFKIQVYKDKYTKCLLVNLQKGHKNVYYTLLNFSINLKFFKMKNLHGVWETVTEQQTIYMENKLDPHFIP